MTPDEADRRARTVVVHKFWTSPHPIDNLGALLLDCGVNGPFLLRPELRDASPEVKDAYRAGVLAAVNVEHSIDSLLEILEGAVQIGKNVELSKQ